MSGCVRKIWRYALQVLCVGLLALLVAGPVPAQDKTPKQPPATPVKPPPCTGKIQTPSAAGVKVRGMEGVECDEAAPRMKKTTRKIGGQEIRAKEGEKGKK